MEHATMMRLENISKYFGKVRALNNISMDIRRNEILGLLGDNGAGKTTLVNIIAGALAANQGRMYFEGQQVEFSSPHEAKQMGIDTVEQHLSLISIMSIARNFYLGRELVKKIGPFKVLDQKRMDIDCKRAVEEIGVRVRSPEDLVSTLSGGERQAIAIGRAFYFGCKLLLLDEPLAALSIKEARKVHEMILQIRDAGSSVVYITHNVFHVYPIADRFVILDRGDKLSEIEKENVSAEAIIEAIATGTPVKT
ncbi:MAG: sugar ABC transporter ATP-binding protein [Spirochaetaceae bacterium]|nr:MAG: sugar ABC transporter ATP-binding protein [Spirochaetaceae bacterium]